MDEELDYPTLGDKLVEIHKVHPELSIQTEIVEYDHQLIAVCRATVSSPKGSFNGSGVASQDKDPEWLDSLLELSESRAVGRALRFAGVCMKLTGAEEIPEKPVTKYATSSQKRAINRIAKSNSWDLIEASRRIVGRADITNLNQLSKEEASRIIKAMKKAVA